MTSQGAGLDPGQDALGALAVEYGLIDAQALERCRALAAATTPPSPLGQLLVSQGLLREGVVRRLEAAARRTPGEATPGDPLEALIAERAPRLTGARLGAWLLLMRDADANELVLAAGAAPRLRVRGRLVAVGDAPLAPAAAAELATWASGSASAQATPGAERIHEEPGVGRFRVQTMRHTGGQVLALRRLADEPPDPEALGVGPVADEVVGLSKGLVLVTGPRRSGKTSTLAAIVGAIARRRQRHVVTLERPIEHLHTSAEALISQREIPRHAPSFEVALKAILREDANVIVLGELDEPERIAVALSAAETGHVVLGTMRTPDAQRTVVRILDGMPARRRPQVRAMLAAMLRLVVSQQLVPSLDGRRLHLAAEVLRATPAVANVIREDRLHQLRQVIETGGPEGMRLMDDALADLVRAGHVSIAEAAARATDPGAFLSHLEARAERPGRR